MAVSQDYQDYICEQLSEFEGFTTKKMFGGVGIFRDGLMFGLISSKEVFYLKVDDTNKADFEAKGMESFNPHKKGKGMPYWEIPVDVLEDKTELAKWAKKSFTIAVNSKKKK